MFDFSDYIDLPLIWAGIIAIAILLYVLLDGFDLGVGILAPFAPTKKCRTKMMNSIAPFWDGNETWLVMGGGGLLAVFPLAYSIIFPALYIPIMLILFSLILRGVAFEFRFKAHNDKLCLLWDILFHVGSLGAAFAQGLCLGAFIEGFEVVDRSFAGGAFDWLTPFSLMTGVALIFGYALLGATWVILKSSGETQIWARKSANYTLSFVAFFMVLVSIGIPFLDARFKELWFDNITWLSLLPLATLVLFVVNWRAINKGKELTPFLSSIGIFFLGFIGFAISLFPWMVPFAFTYEEAAASPESQSLLLVGTLILLPVILAYTAFSYYVFRGKTSDEETY